MELYHAFPFFFYLLGLCLRKEPLWPSALMKLFKIGAVVLFTFYIIWFPFLNDLNQIEQVLLRIFPLNRGLFEDKVANFWCSLNVVYKLKTIFDQEKLALISAIVTLVGVLPSNLILFMNPTKNQFVCSLLNTALGFFLFSYQVHEKSILIVALPALMAIRIFNRRYVDLVLLWFLIVTSFSMWPLLVKDGLTLAFVALQTIFVVICHYIGLFEFDLTENDSMKRSSPKPLTQKDMNKTFWCDWFIWTLFNFSIIGYLVLSFASLNFKPPSKWPHLWPLLISVFSAVHFVFFWIYFNYCQLQSFMNPIPSISDEKKKK